MIDPFFGTGKIFDVIDRFDIVNTQFERDWDHARLQGWGLDWFSRSGVSLHMHLEPAGNFTTCTISCTLMNFHVNTCQNTFKIKVSLHLSWFFNPFPNDTF